jgi:hypothetical protein
MPTRMRRLTLTVGSGPRDQGPLARRIVNAEDALAAPKTDASDPDGSPPNISRAPARHSPRSSTASSTGSSAGVRSTERTLTGTQAANGRSWSIRSVATTFERNHLLSGNPLAQLAEKLESAVVVLSGINRGHLVAAEVASQIQLGQADRLYVYPEVRRLCAEVYIYVGSARELLNRTLEPLRSIQPQRQEPPSSEAARSAFELVTEVRLIRAALDSIDLQSLTDAVLPVIDGSHAERVGGSSRLIFWEVTTARDSIATARQAASDLLLLLVDRSL